MKSKLCYETHHECNGNFCRLDPYLTEQQTCNTCGRQAWSPYRVYDERGKVLQGCVDEFHSGHLVTPSESSHWHNRKEAKKIRHLDAQRIKG